MSDPILDEIHRGRLEHAETFNYNLQTMLDDLRRRERESKEPHRTVPLKPRRCIPDIPKQLPAIVP